MSTLCLVTIFVLLLSLSKAGWSPATPIATFDKQSFSAVVSSLYLDPTSHVTHAVIATLDDPQRYFYYAINEAGKVLNQLQLNVTAGGSAAVCGAGDGKSVQLAINEREAEPIERMVINFTESTDGGASWSQPIQIQDSIASVLLYDMMCVRRRLFLLFGQVRSHRVKLVTRPADSKVFSSERIVARYDVHNNLGAKMAYTLQGNGVIVLHVFYINQNNVVAYVRSDNSGVTWVDPKPVSTERAGTISRVVSYLDENATTVVAVLYTRGTGVSPPSLVMSEDGGQTFSAPASASHGIMDEEFVRVHGLAACDNALFTLAIGQVKRGYPLNEYAAWSLRNWAPTWGTSPFPDPKAQSSELECVAGSDGKVFMTAVTKVSSEKGTTFLFSARSETKTAE